MAIEENPQNAIPASPEEPDFLAVELAQRVLKAKLNEPIATPRFTVFQITVILMTLVVTGTVSFMGGVVYNRQTAVGNSEEFNVFWESWDYLDKNYYYDIPSEQDRVYGAIEGMVTTYNDPYTSFARPQRAEQIRQDLSGIQYGIGAYISTNTDGRFYVVRPIPGSPAERAGLQGGDLFVSVNTINVVEAGWNLDQLVANVKGDKGTSVTLVMDRASTLYEVTIIRDAFEETIVFGQMIDDIGYLKLTSFKAVADGQMQRELEALIAQNPQGIIFDLRENGGGFLDQAQAVADLFLDEGVIAITKRRDQDAEYLYSVDGDSGEQIPMVVLIDGGSASAAEVVAGALQDRGRAILIGQKSFGKGIVQSVIDFDDGSQLKVTTAAWYTPQDRAIHNVGLIPDIVIEGDQYLNGEDLPLQAALDYLHAENTATESVEAQPFLFGG